MAMLTLDVNKGPYDEFAMHVTLTAVKAVRGYGKDLLLAVRA